MRPQSLTPLFAQVTSLPGIGPRLGKLVEKVAGPLVVDLAAKALRREFGSDLLAGMSIVTALALHQYLAGAFVVLMLSGGLALERYAVGRASDVLRALANRMPSVAHRRTDGRVDDVAVTCRIDTVDEVAYYQHGGILQYVLRGMAKAA